MEIPVSPDGLHDEALTPLLENLIKLYSDPPRGDTICSSALEGALDTLDTLDTLDSPSVYSPYPDDEMTPHEKEPPMPSPFTDRRRTTFLHDWDNGIHYREARVFGIPEGRLLAKRAPTVYLSKLLRARRMEAGLPFDTTLDSPSDF